jgi:pantoate--beta-alanine ligase
MQVFKHIHELRSQISVQKVRGKKVGLVPTMGALHRGHLELVSAARRENDVVVTSIFVNPTQFNNPEDLKKYPRTLETDLQLLEAENCDFVFVPEENEIYPEEPLTKIQFGYLNSIMEGAHRPGHFDGVGLVVSKLFNIVQPDRAYFGKKDLQQLTIIKKMVRDLNFDIEIIPYPIVREKDGLAMSSRNARLNDEERKEAPAIYRNLELISERLSKQETSVEAAKKSFVEEVDRHSTLSTEYIEVVDAETLRPVENLVEGKNVSICVAVFAGNIRLIDNVSII